MTTAFSYVRFSSERQQHGSSVSRQVEAATVYAAAHNLTLDTSTYRDLGISAFRSRNRVEGALGAFIEAVDDGKVPTGSFLLIESFDRLSRDTVDVALELFLNLTRKGITVVTLTDQQVYSQSTIRENWTTLIMALAVMARANEESATKSKRIKAVYAGKKARGEIACNTYPGWLEKADKSTFRVLPDKAALINRIFDMALAGFGTRIIARTLHKEGVKTTRRARSWNQALVSGVLRNTAVYGEKEGRNNHYPPIMSKAKFLMTTAAVRGRKWNATRAPSVPNLFAGISYCAHCGSRVRYMPNLETPHIRCKNAADLMECKGKTFPYPACETAFIYTMTRRAALDISGEHIVKSQAVAPAIKGTIETLKDKQKKLLRLTDLAAGVEALADELNVVQRQIDELEAQLAQADNVPLSRKEVDLHKDLFDRYFEAKEAKSPDLVDLRRQMRVAMTRLFKRIEFGVGAKGWEPTLFLTLIDGTRAAVDVVPFLHPRSLIEHKRRVIKTKSRATTK